MVRLNLRPSEDAKPATVFAKMIGTSSYNIGRCFKTPHLHLTFPHIRSTLTEELTWYITIKPSQTFSVSMHHKRQAVRRTHYTRDKRSRELILLLNPHFFLFIFFPIKEKYTLPSGTS